MNDRNTFGSIVNRPSGAPCPHGDDPRYCDRGACDEGWDH